MEIKTRKQAAIDGDKKYFTGVECKNGHLTERYTQSGTCQGCIHAESETPVTLERRALAAGVRQKRLDLGTFVDIRIAILQEDVIGFKALLMAYVYEVNPDISITDLWLSSYPLNGVLYKVRCPIHAVEPLRAEAHRLYSKVNPMIDQVREQIIRNNQPTVEHTELTLEELRR